MMISFSIVRFDLEWDCCWDCKWIFPSCKSEPNRLINFSYRSVHIKNHMMKMHQFDQTKGALISFSQIFVHGTSKYKANLNSLKLLFKLVLFSLQISTESHIRRISCKTDEMFMGNNYSMKHILQFN